MSYKAPLHASIRVGGWVGSLGCLTLAAAVA